MLRQSPPRDDGVEVDDGTGVVVDRGRVRGKGVPFPPPRRSPVGRGLTSTGTFL